MFRSAKRKVIIPQYWLPWETIEGIRKSSSKIDETDPTESEDEISRELFDLVSRGGGWHKVDRRCKTSPFDATYQDEEKYQTPLYVACTKRPPVRIVRALLEAFPDAARVKSRHGDLPLHVACQHNASIGVLSELLKIHPGTAAFRSQWGKTPVNVLWEARESQENQENYSSIFWQKVELLLEAVARHSRYSTRGKASKLFIMHAAVSLPDCPEGVLKFVMHKYPEQAKIPVGHGQLPLHIAVKSPPPSWSLPSKQFLKRSGNRSDTVLGRYSDGAERPESAISRLLQLYPDAAKQVDPQKEHRFPLHTAILHCHQWYGGVRELFEAAPEAMHVVDPIHGFYPFQLAAVPMETSSSSSSSSAADMTDLDSIYHLLRDQPASLEDFIRTQRREAQARAAARQVIRAAARKMLAERKARKEAEKALVRQREKEEFLEAQKVLHGQEEEKRKHRQKELKRLEAMRVQKLAHEKSRRRRKSSQKRKTMERRKSKECKNPIEAASPQVESTVHHHKRILPVLKKRTKTFFPEKVFVSTESRAKDASKSSSIAKAKAWARRKQMASSSKVEKKSHCKDPPGKTIKELVHDQIVKAKKKESRRRQAQRRERRRSIPFEINPLSSPSRLPENISVGEEPNEVSKLTTFRPWYAVVIGEQITI